MYEDPLTALRNERDLYRVLLELAHQDDREQFLAKALSLVMRATGAVMGYLELQDTSGIGDGEWWLAEGFSASDVEAIRAETSRGIVAETLANGGTVHTRSAMQDPRFQTLESVRRNDLREVVCTRVTGGGCTGVIYLQGDRGDMPLHPEAREHIELFARHLGPLAEGLLGRTARRSADPTLLYRRKLELSAFVGRSQALASVFEQVFLLAPLQIHVLLTGQSGTGKSALVRSLVANGPRAARPLLHLNCAAIPETLFESELFGAARGAHSTAESAVQGKLTAAEGGTLFLDEISELALGAQAKLLRFIQTQRYHPLGSAAERVADVRIVAASNVPLETLVQEGRFRADLMYRLQVLPIRMPSLSERADDIPDLVHHFCRQSVRKHGLGPMTPSEGMIRVAQATAWPGNIRQLENAVEAGAIRANGARARFLEVSHLFPDRPPEEEDAPLSFSEATRSFQRGLLTRALDECDWNVSDTARKLGIARSHVYNLLDSFSIRRGDG